jgi:hypothetical protein
MVDGDGTYDLTDLPRLVVPEADMVVGVRTGSWGRSGGMRALGALGLSKLAGWLTGADCPDLLSGFRMFKAGRLSQIRLWSKGFELETELTMTFIRRGFHVEWIPVGYHRRIGKSKLRPFRDGLIILSAMAKAMLRSG